MNLNQFLFYCCLCLLCLNSCNKAFQVKDGRTAVKYKYYNDAVPLLRSEINREKDPEKSFELTKLLGDSYFELNEFEEAQKWYRRAMEINNNKQLLLKFGLAQKALGDYSSAIQTFDLYLKEVDNSSYIARREIRACKMAQNSGTEYERITIETVDDLNTNNDDFAPVLYKDGALSFSSSSERALGTEKYGWTGEKYGDIFVAYPGGKRGFKTPESIDQNVNTTNYEGTHTFNQDYTQLIFSRCVAKAEGENVYCKLYQSSYEKFKWSTPEQLTFFADSINVVTPHLSKDGKRLFFAADELNNFGGKDIYYVEWQNNRWSEPYNAGRFVNTEGDEKFPYEGPDGLLYFSSNGLEGYGGLDIYTTKKGEVRYTKAINIGAPINSSSDDFGYIISRPYNANPKDDILEQGYFTSNRNENQGDDIFSFTNRFLNWYHLTVDVSSPVIVRGDTLEIELLDSIPVEISAEGFDTTIYTDDSGRVELMLQKNKDYNIFASAKDYFNKSTSVSTINLKDVDNPLIELTSSLVLDRIEYDEITIPNIYYDLDSAALRPESFPVLDSLLTFFKDNDDLYIEIGSHTDSRGDDDYNQDLSQRRAQSVINYLNKKGVNDENLLATGYGETKLTNDCTNDVPCDEDQHQANRRTTFRVVSEKEAIDIQSKPTQPKDQPEEKSEE